MWSSATTAHAKYRLIGHGALVVADHLIGHGALVVAALIRVTKYHLIGHGAQRICEGYGRCGHRPLRRYDFMILKKVIIVHRQKGTFFTDTGIDTAPR